MKKIAEFFKALGDETRLKIINMLAEQEMCVCEILDKLNMSQPAVSHHLKILRQAGLVKDSRDGKWIYYSLNGDVFKEVFEGEEVGVVEAYAEPIKRKLNNLQPSPVRTDPSICEKLTMKKAASKK
ncbi:ArsR/SmtB family transcription factor [Thermincola ferriacetica]